MQHLILTRTGVEKYPGEIHETLDALSQAIPHVKIHILTGFTSAVVIDTFTVDPVFDDDDNLSFSEEEKAEGYPE